MTSGYRVAYTQKAVKELKKLDPYLRNFILAWVEKNLVDCLDPRAHGRGLVGDHTGEWRYRIGDYRLIADIYEEEILILILTVGHRKLVY